jgi:hypothetical protein
MPVVGCTPFALLPRVVRAPVLGRAYSATPTLFHAGLYKILREIEGEGPKYFARMSGIIWLLKCRIGKVTETFLLLAFTGLDY